MQPRFLGVVRVAMLAMILAVALAASAQAESTGSPSISLDDGAPASILHGEAIPVTLTAANPDGPYGYNLAFRYVLPAGASYVAGSESTRAGEPRILADAPSDGETTLIWPDVDDLSPGSSRSISFKLRYDPSTYDVGDTIETEAGAYISTQPRDEADFNPDGTPGDPGPGSWTGGGTDDAGTRVTAIEVDKSEPHPEGEIPRGLHDHQTVYSLEVTNNRVNPTDAVRLEDYLPAGLEFLGCQGTPDHTTDAPTNPGSRQEYPGSGPIEVRAVPDCVRPDTVETVETDPDGDGPLPAGVYTHVVWDDIGDFGASDTKVIRYAAAIPIRENTMDWTGGQAPDASGSQAANLDNNSGPETRDEQRLLNGAIASGTYRSPGKPGLEVSDEGTLLRTAEDLAIQKSNDNRALSQGDLTKWTIDAQVSEYRYLDDVTIHDVVPDGLCPLGPVNEAHDPSGDDSQCDPVSGKLPSRPYTTVEEQPDGSYDVTWTRDSFPRLAHLKPNETVRLSFWTRTRTDYQQDFAAAGPVLSNDSVTNDIETDAASFVRCEGGNPDCADPAPGHKIDSDWTDGDHVTDVSGSSKAATGPTLEKTVAANYPPGGDCTDLAAADYGKAVPAYGPGDRVCWRLRVVFPADLDTHSLDVNDVLPSTLDYVPGSWRATPGENTAEIGSIDTGTPGRLIWPVGDDDDVDAGGKVFDVTFQTTVGSPEGHHSGDVVGNLLKFSYENTAGTSFALRDRTDFKLSMPELDLVKGVEDVDGEPAGGNPPDTDHKQVRGGDAVTYRVDVANDGARDASSSRIRDLLPEGIGCADLVPGSISDGGTCSAAGSGPDRIQWSGIALAHGASKTLTYTVRVPTGVSPDQKFVNTAGVLDYEFETDDGHTYTMVPDNDVVKDGSETPNTFPAEDASDIYTPASTVAKSRTTSVGEAGNDADSQATIGERIDYTVTTTIPKGTTLYGSPTVVDPLGDRQTLVPGSLCDTACTFDGHELPGGGVTVSESPANTITAKLPQTYANTTGRDVKLVLHFSTTVDDVDANTRGSALGNTATLTYEDQLGRAVIREGSVSTRIVEPEILASKTDDTGGDRVSAGQVVGFRVKASAAGGSHRSTAHDVTVVDTLPAGTEPVDGDGDPVADGDAVGPQGGIWDQSARTITWTPATTPALGAIAPGSSVPLDYRARVESPAVVGHRYRNAVIERTSSLAGPDSGERTSSSTASTAGDYDSEADDTLRVELPSITKDVSPDPVTNGNRVAWHLRVSIPPHLRSFDTTVTDVVPDGFDVDGYGSATCASGCLGNEPAIGSFPAEVRGDGTTLAAWFLGDLGPSAQPRVYDLVLNGHLRDTYRDGGAHVADGQKLVNRASVSTDRTDEVPDSPDSLPDRFDDTAGPATATSHVVEPRLDIDKSADRGPKVSPGQRLTYTVKVTNDGHSPAYDTVVRDRPDTELVDVEAADGAAWVTKAWAPDDRRMEWTVPGPIPVGGSVTLTYTASVAGSSSLHDDDSIDNTAAIDEYFGVPSDTRGEHPDRDYHRYSGPDDSVHLKPDFPDLVLKKTTGADGHPDIADADLGQPFGWHVVVTNEATEATAYDVDVTDTLPPNWEYVPGSSDFTPGGGSDPSQGGSLSAGKTLSWSNVADLAPGQSLVVDFEARPTLAAALSPGHGSAHPHTNRASSSGLDSTGSAGNADGPYESNSDTAEAILLAPDLDIDKTPDDGTAVAGTDSSFTIKVKNTGEATAHGVTVDDTLPSGLTYTANTATASPSAGFTETGPLSWRIGTIAAGKTVTITLPVHVAASVPDGTRLVNHATTVADDVPTPHSDDGSLKVHTEGDVGVVKTDDPDPVVAGTDLDYTIVATNHGPSDARDVVIHDVLPSPDLSFVSADAPCTHAGNAITCELGTLAAGASRTVHVRAKVSPDQQARIRNTATVTTSTIDDDPGNDSSTAVTDVITRADVSIVKTADHRHYDGGDTITYRLLARNDGPSTARAVKVRDALPGEVGFVSVAPGAPTCSQSGGTVGCELGSLRPGASRTIVIKARAKGDPPRSDPSHHDHQLTVTKQEAYLSIQAGQTATRELVCANGGEVADGSFRVESVDQGESLEDVHVLRNASTGPHSYGFTVRNDTGGQAQVKVFTICLPPGTEASEGHSHPLIEGDPITTTANGLATGRHTLHIDAPLGYRAVAPGIVVASGDARLVGSEDDGNGGWDFTVEVTSPSADIALSVRPLKETTGISDDHSHDLLFTHPVIHVVVPAGQKATARVSCPVGYEGITATYEIPPGVLLLGDEPEPVNRDFDLLNTTGHDISVDLDLICLAVRTGPEIDPLDPVVNTATVSTATTDPDHGNDSSSVGVTISRERGSAPPAAPSPAPAPQGLAAPQGKGESPTGTGEAAGPTIRVKRSKLTFSARGNRLTVPVICSGAGRCHGRLTVSGRVKRKRGKGSARRSRIVLGRARFKLAAGKRARVKVKVKRRFRHLARSHRLRRLKVTLGGRTVTRRARVTGSKKKKQRRKRAHRRRHR